MLDSQRFSEQETDSRLVQLFLRGKAEAFEQLIDRYEVEAFTLAMHLLADEDHAAEVVRQAFLDISRQLRRGEAEEFDILVHRYTYETALKAICDSVSE